MYIGDNFIEGTLCMDNQQAFDQLEVDIGTKGLTMALKTFGHRVSDSNMVEFLEHVSLSFNIDLEQYTE